MVSLALHRLEKHQVVPPPHSTSIPTGAALLPVAIEGDSRLQIVGLLRWRDAVIVSHSPSSPLTRQYRFVALARPLLGYSGVSSDGSSVEYSRSWRCFRPSSGSSSRHISGRCWSRCLMISIFVGRRCPTRSNYSFTPVLVRKQEFGVVGRGQRHLCLRFLGRINTWNSFVFSY